MASEAAKNSPLGGAAVAVDEQGDAAEVAPDDPVLLAGEDPEVVPGQPSRFRRGDVGVAEEPLLEARDVATQGSDQLGCVRHRRHARHASSGVGATPRAAATPGWTTWPVQTLTPFASAGLSRTARTGPFAASSIT